MWQRIVATKAAAATVTPWIGVLCTTAVAVSVSVSMNANANANANVNASENDNVNANANADAVSPSSSPSPPSHSVSSGSLLTKIADAAVRDATAIHRSRCDAAAPSPPRRSSGSSFLASFREPDPPDEASPRLLFDNDASFEPVTTPDRYAAPQHAIFGTLAGDSRIEAYEVYRPTRTTPLADEKLEANTNLLVLVATVSFGTHLNGHGGVVHGGILSLLFDDIMGWGCNEVLSPSKVPVTANLNVDFRRPVSEGTRVRIEVVLERKEGRKLFWKARMLGALDENGEEVLYAEATSLYIVLKDKT